MVELFRQVGVEGCVGGSEGVDAFSAAVGHRHVDIMAVLIDTGCGSARGGEVGRRAIRAVPSVPEKGETCRSCEPIRERPGQW